MTIQWYKRYIDVVAHINQYGEIKPLMIIFEHRKYPIDKILEIKQAHSQVGGSGIRYRCRIQNQERNLFLERNRWFIESSKP